MAALTRICERLDDVAVSYFEVLKELEDMRRKYAVNASEGYFALTQARYAMGVGAVSQLQYDATMTAQSHVSVENSEHDPSGSPNPSVENSEHGHSGSPNPSVENSEHDHSWSPDPSVENSEHGHSGSPNPSVENSEHDHSWSLDPSDKSTVFDFHHIKHDGSTVSSQKDHPDVMLRKRGHAPAGVEEVKQGTVTSDEKDQSAKSTKDPLLWFGVLVSPHLRNSQKNFIQAATYACQLATMQAKLLDLKKEYLELMDKKRTLLRRKEQTIKTEGTNNET